MKAVLLFITLIVLIEHIFAQYDSTEQNERFFSHSNEDSDELGDYNLIKQCINGDISAWKCCAAAPKHWYVYLRHPTICEKYYVCEHRLPVLKKCPRGLHWSVKKERCTKPKDADCNTVSTTTKPPIVTTTKKPDTTKGCLDGSINAKKCCSLGYKYLADPENCHKYYRCIYGLGKPVSVTCPHGLNWSIKKQECVYPIFADCKPNPTEPTTSTTTTSSTTISTTIKPTVPKGCLDGSINAKKCCSMGWFKYLADPDNCHKYYKCVYGHPVSKTCPYGLNWSYKLQKCVLPQLSECGSKPNTTSTTAESVTTTTQEVTTKPSTNFEETTTEAVTSTIEDIVTTTDSVITEPIPTTGATTSITTEETTTTKYTIKTDEQTTEESIATTTESTTMELSTTTDVITSIATEQPTTTTTEEQTTKESTITTTEPTTIELTTTTDATTSITIEEPTTTTTEEHTTKESTNTTTELTTITDATTSITTEEPTTTTEASTTTRTEEHTTEESTTITTEPTKTEPTTTTDATSSITTEEPTTNTTEEPNTTTSESSELTTIQATLTTTKPTTSTTTEATTIKITTESTSTTTVSSGDGGGVCSTISYECRHGIRSAVECCEGVSYWQDVLLQNNANCSTYFQCVHEQPEVRNCPGGLRWNADLCRCEWPQTSTCNL